MATVRAPSSWVRRTGWEYLPRVREAAVDVATPALLCVLLLIILGFRFPQLYSSNGLAGAITASAPLILSVLAMTSIAISSPGGIDLSIGPFVAFVNVGIVHWLVPHGLGNPLYVFAYAIGVGIAFQMIQGLLIGLLRLQPVIVTLSGYLVFSGLNLVVLPNPEGTIPHWLNDWGAATSVNTPELYLLIGCFVLWGFFARTTFARNIRLVGGNDKTAWVSGLNPVLVRLGAHIVAGVFVGLAGITLTALLQSADPTQGAAQTLMAVTALVVGGVSLSGGRGRALGAVLGAIAIFLIGYVIGTLNLGTSESFVSGLIYGAVLIIALFIGSITGSALGVRKRAAISTEVSQ